MDDSPTPSPECPADRRVFRDRRRRPTTLLSTLRPGGRRRGFRRRGEERNQYVDRPAARVVALTLTIVLFSAFDALFTLLHLEAGGREVNPIMELILFLGVPVFVAAKAGLTDMGVIFLAIHHNFRLGRVALRATAAAYSVLIIYHASLVLVGM